MRSTKATDAISGVVLVIAIFIAMFMVAELFGISQTTFLRDFLQLFN